ncbi:Carbonyl reductase family member 4 [Acipenser ruthenus]|uniref:3-ketoacyl-[acyl-carrier-protein] reductase beta subunit n=1 Tax=Acipenser ruthenus TaxID=7906 RepID=A0A444TYX9_ACIRT|nr:Carbonyl reductase family member 4 [Acipenser ruthenus]
MSKLCAVFGGSRGIGKAVSQLLAEKGHRVVVIARDLDAAHATASTLGADHVALKCDVSKEQEIQQTWEKIQTGLGHVSYLVNAAGVNRFVTYPLIADLSVKLTLCILTEGSIVGLKGNAGQSAYSASKAGLVGFTRSLAKEVAGRNIRVNLVAPGFIHTDMTSGMDEEDRRRTIPLGRFGEPKDVAHAILFLLESPYITGQVLVVDGGLQLTM